jgi:hypothetical protein
MPSVEATKIREITEELSQKSAQIDNDTTTPLDVRLDNMMELIKQTDKDLLVPVEKLLQENPKEFMRMRIGKRPRTVLLYAINNQLISVVRSILNSPKITLEYVEEEDEQGHYALWLTFIGIFKFHSIFMNKSNLAINDDNIAYINFYLETYIESAAEVIIYYFLLKAYITSSKFQITALKICKKFDDPSTIYHSAFTMVQDKLREHPKMKGKPLDLHEFCESFKQQPVETEAAEISPVLPTARPIRKQFQERFNIAKPRRKTVRRIPIVTDVEPIEEYGDFYYDNEGRRVPVPRMSGPSEHGIRLQKRGGKRKRRQTKRRPKRT